jgi:hypothetical protein
MRKSIMVEGMAKKTVHLMSARKWKRNTGRGQGKIHLPRTLPQ